MIEAALKEEGYAVSKALSGEEGLEAAKRDLPGLIVLDIVMPGMSGFDVARALRSDEKTAAIPIIVLTSMDLSQQDRETQRGCSHHQKKKAKSEKRILLSRSGKLTRIWEKRHDSYSSLLKLKPKKLKKPDCC